MPGCPDIRAMSLGQRLLRVSLSALANGGSYDRGGWRRQPIWWQRLLALPDVPMRLELDASGALIAKEIKDIAMLAKALALKPASN